MGFILSSCHRTFVWNFMTLLLISGVWKHSISVCGTLDQSEEETGQFHGSNNHVHEGAHSHEDGFCDCNAQGAKKNNVSVSANKTSPWQPLFKPSQVVPRDEPELDSTHSSENSIASSSNQQIRHLPSLPSLPSDLVPPEFANGQRQAKKQNHMIHLHLIPHIYVPVLHPVVHPVAYGNQHHDRPLTQETHPHPVYHSSEEPEGDYGHNDHDPPPVPHLDGVSAEQNIRHEVSNHINVGGDSSHESEEIHNPGGYPYYPSESHVHHQYEVHEEPPHDPYENHPSASHTKSQILAPHTPLAQLPTRPPSPPNVKLQYFHNRNLINKKFMNVPVNMRQLRIMRPPPLGQKETWLLRSRFPPKTFDFSKHPFFEFKPNRRQTPLVVIPATILKRRDDRMLKT